MRFRLLVFLLLPLPCFAQTGAITGVALDSVGNTVAGATITACPQGSSGIPCSPVTASTTSNGQGAFSVTVPIGTYTVTVFRSGVVATSSTVVVAPSNITVANNVTYSGSVTFSGSLTVSGAGTYTGPTDIGKDNNIFVVGSTLYPTCQAAVTAAGTTNKALLIVRSDYTGAACPTGLSATNSNLVIWDFTGNQANESNARQYNGQMWNVNDGVVNAMRKSNFSIESASNFGGTATAVVNGYWITTVNTTTVPTGGTADGISAEANTQNSMSGTLGALTAAEHNSTNRSTGGTITNQQGVMGSVNSDPASTTVVTNAQGVWGRGCKTISGSVPTNCYGLRADDQGNIASNRNFSLYGVGKNLVGFSSTTNIAAWYFEDNVNAIHAVLFNDNSNFINLQATGANGIVLNDSGGNIKQQINASGTQFKSPIFLNTGSGLLISTTAPTIAAAGCGGAAASIVVSNGTAAFKVNVGTTPTSACTLTFPAATTGWNVTCNDITTQSTAVFVQKQTGAESTTSVTITNFSDVAVATAFVASDILKCTASAD